jgi:hypothetical protein
VPTSAAQRDREFSYCASLHLRLEFKRDLERNQLHGVGISSPGWEQSGYGTLGRSAVRRDGDLRCTGHILCNATTSLIENSHIQMVRRGGISCALGVNTDPLPGSTQRSPFDTGPRHKISTSMSFFSWRSQAFRVVSVINNIQLVTFWDPRVWI